MACSHVQFYGTDMLVWACGKARIAVCSHPGCPREGVVLCDGHAPGKRRTCDRPLCLAHAAEIASDRHLCAEHAAGILGATLGPRPVTRVEDVDDLTRCRDARCPFWGRCLRWTDCADTAVKAFDFGATKDGWRWRCRWFDPFKA